MKELSIGELGRTMGISSSAIRYYESMGLIAEPMRVGGKRRYSEEDILKLKQIQLAKDTGFTVYEIQQLFKEQKLKGRKNWGDFANQKVKELDNKIKNIAAMKKLLLEVLACHCEEAKSCSIIQKRGHRHG